MSAKKLFILLLPILLLTTLGFIGTVQAYYVIVESPVNGATYSSSNIWLNYTINTKPPSDASKYHIYYSLDNGQFVYLDGLSGRYCINTKFTNGPHEIKIKLECTYDIYGVKLDSTTVRFFVNDGVGPNVSVMYKQLFPIGNAQVVITTDLPDATVSYSLNGQANITLPKTELDQQQDRYQYNLNLTDLTDGTHTIAAYASDVMNNTGVAEKTFTVETGSIEPTIEPTQPPTNTLPPIAFVAGGAIAGVIIASVILLFHRRAKPKQTEIVKI